LTAPVTSQRRSGRSTSRPMRAPCKPSSNSPLHSPLTTNRPGAAVSGHPSWWPRCSRREAGWCGVPRTDSWWSQSRLQYTFAADMRNRSFTVPRASDTVKEWQGLAGGLARVAETGWPYGCASRAALRLPANWAERDHPVLKPPARPGHRRVVCAVRCRRCKGRQSSGGAFFAPSRAGRPGAVREGRPAPLRRAQRPDGVVSEGVRKVLTR
jgi:hypothetical protein